MRENVKESLKAVHKFTLVRIGLISFIEEYRVNAYRKKGLNHEDQLHFCEMIFELGINVTFLESVSL